MSGRAVFWLSLTALGEQEVGMKNSVDKTCGQRRDMILPLGFVPAAVGKAT